MITLFWGHTQLCSGLNAGSALKNYFGLAWGGGGIQDAGDQTWVALCTMPCTKIEMGTGDSLNGVKEK